MIVSRGKKRKKKSSGTHEPFASLKRGRAGQENDLLSVLNKMQGPSTAARMGRKPRKAKGDSYIPPSTVVTTTIGELLHGIREIPEQHQARFGITPEGGSGVKVWAAGDLSLVKLPCVAIVGARDVSPEGAARARRLARELSQAGVVVVSGLAKGVDTEALTAAIEAKGKTIAVIGTPITRAFPAENKRLQEEIYGEHLLISQFAPGKTVFPRDRKS